MARGSNSRDGRVARSEGFPFKSRFDIEKALDGELAQRYSKIHAEFPYEKFPAKNEELIKQARAEVEAKYKPIFKEEQAIRKNAKNKEVQAKAEAKAAKEDERNRVVGVATGVIKGLEPQRVALTDRFLEWREQDYSKMVERIEKVGGNLEELFPLKKRGQTYSNYVDHDKMNDFIQSNKANLERYTVEVPYVRNGQPVLMADGTQATKPSTRYRMKASPDKSSWVSEASRNAEAIIAEFAAKIVVKTEEYAKEKNSDGEVIVGTPKIQSNASDPWASSRITIETNKRTVTWKTNMIVNRSVYNKHFNQWPTTLESDEEK
jgi:hypothetical protein